jgi:hypothetical protein
MVNVPAGAKTSRRAAPARMRRPGLNSWAGLKRFLLEANRAFKYLHARAHGPELGCLIKAASPGP